MARTAYPPSLTRSQLLRLYKATLTAARAFPSIKRDAIIEDIRVEWRAGAPPGTVTDRTTVAHRIEVAIRGLQTLQKYSGLDAGASAWVVDLEQSPLGSGSASPADDEAFTPVGSAQVTALR